MDPVTLTAAGIVASCMVGCKILTKLAGGGKKKKTPTIPKEKDSEE